MSRPPARFVGVDGGGTTTRVLVTDGEGRELVRVSGGPASLVDARHPRAAAKIVADLVEDALKPLRPPQVERPGSSGTPPPVRVLHAALAGAGWEPVRSVVQRALAEEELADEVRVGTDVEAAFHDAFGSGSGLLVLAGTGSVAWGRSEEGRVGRAGGWGGLLGDEGSGWSIGLRGLRAVARAVDGRGPPTRLVEGVVGQLDLAVPEELMSWIRSASKAEVASLVELVGRAAEEKDVVAAEILGRAVWDLEAHVTTLARRLGPWTPGEGGGPIVALAGGLLEPGGVLRTDVGRALEGRGMELAAQVPDPVRGAAALARLDWKDRSGTRGRGRS